ncbi:MAG: hypothetical protein H6659_06760 [Ardenticatenaceae bacterium]|nr:hypothetical protein [Ardenticatenaceae bacterium]
MNRAVKSIAQRLLDAELAINNTLSNPIILGAVTPFGYTEERLEAARTLYQEARELVDQQKLAYGEQFEATQIVKRTYTEATLAYNAAVKVARVAFRDSPSGQNALSLNGPRKKNMSGWLDQARRFYSNMLQDPKFIAAMTPYSYDQTKLEAEAALIEAVATARGAQDRARGIAQEMTQKRDLKLEQLDRWLADYKAIAEVALAVSPQQMEQLGWTVA